MASWKCQSQCGLVITPLKESDGTYRAGEVVGLERADVNQSHTGLGCQCAAGRKRVEHIKQM